MAENTVFDMKAKRDLQKKKQKISLQLQQACRKHVAGGTVNKLKKATKSLEITTIYVHKMSKNTVVECVVITVVSRYGDENWKSKQLSVSGTIDRSLLPTVTINSDCT